MLNYTLYELVFYLKKKIIFRIKSFDFRKSDLSEIRIISEKFKFFIFSRFFKFFLPESCGFVLKKLQGVIVCVY